MIVHSLTVYGQSFFVDKLSNERIIKKTYITIGYNLDYFIPNYVGEILTKSMLVGQNSRETVFHNEDNIYVSSGDYTNSGFDRGHLSPAADFKFSKIGMYESFSMANIAPQYPKLNRGNWKRLEKYVRSLTKYVDTLYVISGTIVKSKETKIKNKIIVPTHFYKAVIGTKNNKFKISCAWIFSNNINNILEEQLSINKLEKIISRNLFYKINNEKIEGRIILPK